MARRIHNRKAQTFRVAQPGAKSVLLAGTFTKWEAGAIPMTQGAGGVWTVTVKLLPGEHAYRFIVDGEWRDDPECPHRTPNPFGSHDMVRQVM
jgi:1,4-alpha-glucan branching enzyme